MTLRWSNDPGSRALDAQRLWLFALFGLLGSLVVLAAGVLAGRPSAVAAPLGVVGVIAAVRLSRVAVPWTNTLAFMLAVIFFIPIKRYSLPGSTSFDLEPYRVIVALILAGWFLSLLADRTMRWRRTFLDRPIGLLLAIVLVSELMNAHRVAGLGSDVIKALTFFLSFVLVYYLFTSTIRNWDELERIITLLVGFGCTVALTALFEAKTHVNIFNHLHSVFPFLQLEPAGLISVSDLSRNGGLRAYASAQHPIALGALFVLLLPLAVYLAQTRSKRWWCAAFLLLLGMLTTGSRTAIIMLLADVIIYLRLRRAVVARFWPALLPALIAVHFALPGTIGGIRAAFFPKGGLVKQQDNVVRGNQLRSNGRLADIRPALRSIEGKPLTGLGFGTRITAGPKTNAAVYDDAWLGALVETGAIGIFAWLWIFVRSVRRLTRAGREDRTARGWLFVALAAALTSFAVGMLTYDGFSFIQVTFMVFILLGVAERALSLETPPRLVLAPTPAPG